MREVIGRVRTLRLLFLVVAAVVAVVLSRRWPEDQVVHVVLGDVSPRVAELRVRYAEASGGPGDDWQREVSFRFALGKAPRVVDHGPRLASGWYNVEVDVSVVDGAAAVRTVSVSRRVELRGHPVSVDVAAAVSDGSREVPSPP
jgi:hypothetical protein